MVPALAKFRDRLRRYASSPAEVVHTLGIFAQTGTVARSPLFDRAWYLRENPDIAATGENPVLHYLACGAASGKDPGPGFCGAEYLSLNPAARASRLNPLVHYERVGRRNGARVSTLQPLLADGRADPGWRFPTPAEHQAAFPAKVAAIRARVARGDRVRAVFLVADAAMFPARRLFEAMRRDSFFDARVAVVPDLRGITADAEGIQQACRAALGADYPADAFIETRRGADGEWRDILADFKADIVCHPTPYDLSDYRYNVRYAVGRDCLPIYVNYGYPCTAFAPKVFALASFAWCWKVFLESEEACAAYAAASTIGGANGEVVGAVKMDALADWPHVQKARKTVLVCPHHSVEGGANDLVALSNFARLADFFVSLPSRYPQIDFVFRPHPFLFPVLARPKFWGAAKCAAWRARFLAQPNARWSEGGAYLRAFAEADAIIQDCASFLAEWQFTGRPCCYILKSPDDAAAKFLPVGRDCLACCDLAYGEGDIAAFIEKTVLGGSDPKAAERARLRDRLGANFPHAADVALAAIARALR